MSDALHAGLERTASTIGVLKFNVGQDFDIVTVSFNPKETPDLAQAKKASYLDRYKREGAGSGWHFLTGTQHSIESLTGRVGFRYAYNPSVDQYAHASGIMVLTPDGELSRYFFGIEYAPRDLQLALIEASDRRIGSLDRPAPAVLFPLRPGAGALHVHDHAPGAWRRPRHGRRHRGRHCRAATPGAPAVGPSLSMMSSRSAVVIRQSAERVF